MNFGYFRVFFARWVNPQPDGSYLTLEQANQAAIQYIRDWTSKHGNNDAVYMNALNAEVGEKLVILGDASLRFSDLSPFFYSYLREFWIACSSRTADSI